MIFHKRVNPYHPLYKGITLNTYTTDYINLTFRFSVKTAYQFRIRRINPKFVWCKL